MSIIFIDDIIESVHAVEDSLAKTVDKFTKTIQETVDALAVDPDADNSNNVILIPRQFYSRVYYRVTTNDLSTGYTGNNKGNGYQNWVFCADMVLNDGVLTLSNNKYLGKSEYNSSRFVKLTEADITRLENIANAWTAPFTFPSSYPEEKIVNAYTPTCKYYFKPKDHSIYDLNMVMTRPPEANSSTQTYNSPYVQMQSGSVYEDTDTGYIYGVNYVGAPLYTNYKRPFCLVTDTLAAATDYVAQNGATNNNSIQYTASGGNMTLYYGDNYMIYYIPAGVSMSYNDIYNLTSLAANTINNNNPSQKPIKVPTYNENKYPPVPPTPTSDDDDVDEQDMGVGTNLGGLGGYWLLTKAQLEDLHTALNTAPVGFDPLNSFISLMGLGVDASKVLDATQFQYVTPINIRMSDGTTWQTHVEAHIISDSEIVSAFSSDAFRIQRKYNNFLDYSPYATHELFIPMCGWVTLPDIAVDRDIIVTYIPDIESCKCRAVVSVVSNSEDDDGNGCVIAEKDGIMGSDVPFSNVGHSLFVGDAIINGANVAGEAITMAIGAGFTKTGASGKTFRPYEGFTLGGSGTLPSAIGNALVSGNINRTHFMTGNSTKTGFSDGESIIVKSVYHIPDMPDNYAHTVGLVCNKTGQLTEFNGFTVCDNPHITFSALEAEKEEIKRLLEEGVILPSGE